jgi:hypothetical protein
MTAVDGDVSTTGPPVLPRALPEGMSTAAAATAPAPDRRLLVAATLLLAGVFFAGFAHSYYLRPWFVQRRVLPWVVHAHGILMTGWVALFVAQVLLAYRGRLDLHRRLGVLGAYLAPLAVALGEFVVVRGIRLRFPAAPLGQSLLLFVAFDGVNLLVFAALAGSALWLRDRSDVHKRLMLLAVVSALPPALGRIAALTGSERAELLVLVSMVAMVGACVLADTVRHRRLHPAMAWGALAILLSCLAAYAAQLAT